MSIVFYVIKVETGFIYVTVQTVTVRQNSSNDR